MHRASIQHLKRLSIKNVNIRYSFNPSQLHSLVSKRRSYSNFEKALSFMKKAQFVLKKKEHDDIEVAKRLSIKIPAKNLSPIRSVSSQSPSKLHRDKENSNLLSNKQQSELRARTKPKSKDQSPSKIKKKRYLRQPSLNKGSKLLVNPQRKPQKRFDMSIKVPDRVKKKLAGTFIMGSQIHEIFKMLFVSQQYFKLKVDPVRLRSFILGYCLWLVSKEEIAMMVYQ